MRLFEIHHFKVSGMDNKTYNETGFFELQR